VRLRSALLPALALATGGCAMRTDVVRLERQIASQQREMSRADSARAAGLAAVARLVQGLLDSLAVQQDALTRLRGDLRGELFNVQQQLVVIQELTGQSQQRLSELRSQIDQRSGQVAAPEPPAGQPAPGGAPPSAPGAAAPVSAGTAPGVAAPGALTPPGTPANPVTPEPTADQLMELALQQLRRGSPGTARVAFAEFLRRFRAHPRAADAEFFTGEAWAAEQRADSAAAAYRRVVDRYPASPRAASALYKLAVRALGAERRDEARTLFNRVVTAYPASEEAALARDQLRSLTPGR
jgi:tol-pal system protein YbgF